MQTCPWQFSANRLWTHAMHLSSIPQIHPRGMQARSMLSWFVVWGRLLLEIMLVAP